MVLTWIWDFRVRPDTRLYRSAKQSPGLSIELLYRGEIKTKIEPRSVKLNIEIAETTQFFAQQI